MKKALFYWFVVLPVVVLVSFAVFNPPEVEAVPSYARQTGLPCSGCHYTPPELNPAGRRFKLLGYVDRADETKVVKTDGDKKRAALDLLASLPLSVMFETSFTSTKSPVPSVATNPTPPPAFTLTPTQNGTFEFPQDVSLYLAGAWTSHIGSFLQVTYDYQSSSFGADNTDVRYANKTNLSGKELIYGLDFNNNPTVEDLWNTVPAWGFPWVESDFAPLPVGTPIINGALGQDVAGFGGYGMWNNHLYLNTELYRSDHLGSPQPNPAAGFTYNIRGLAPYWRVAWQELTGQTQYEIGGYGMHMRSTPNGLTGFDGLQDEYTDWALDTQIDRSLFRKDVLSFRATYIRENSDLLASFITGAVAQGPHHLNTVFANAEYHFGNRYTGTFGWFDTSGTPDTTLYSPTPVTGSANSNPRSAGYIANVSYWPWQNLQLAAQYTGYTRFNGGSTNYDGFGRNASANDTVYLVMRVLF
jgi:hypothetical protein